MSTYNVTAEGRIYLESTVDADTIEEAVKACLAELRKSGNLMDVFCDVNEVGTEATK